MRTDGAVAERSSARLTLDDLHHLASIAARDLEERIQRRPRWKSYADRVVATALCQGAALHFVDGTNGVKDFDIWTFFEEIRGEPFPARWRTTADFGASRFGRRESEPDGTYMGRRVDLIGRSIRASVRADTQTALRRYLHARETKSARMLAEKAVVILAPETLLGEVIWPNLAPTASDDDR